MSSAALIDTAGLRKSYRTGEVDTIAVAGVDLSIAVGDYIVLTGPSGCGKSTLMSLLGLIDEPSGGKIRIDGVDVLGLGDAARARIRGERFGFIYQAYNLIAQLNAIENVMLPLSLRSDVPRKVRRERAMALLDSVGLADRATHFPDQLSGGQQQRVAIARALVGRPQVLFADEPTGNLDSSNGEQVMALIDAAHREGTTVCLVTHDPRFVDRGTRLVPMRDGRISTTNGLQGGSQ